jgi:hypothetical protein
MHRALPLLAFALGACATIPPPAAGPTAALGQTAVIEGVRIRPIAVVEDSRCPINARCIWAGRLVVRTRIDGGAGAEVADLTLGKPLDLGGVSVTLVGGEPGKMAGTETRPSDYRLTFAVQR